MYQISASYGPAGSITYRCGELLAYISAGVMIVQHVINGKHDTILQQVITPNGSPVTDQIEAIEKALAAGHISEPCASCLCMLVEEPWCEGVQS